MTDLDIVKGSADNWKLQLKSRRGTAAMGFVSTDVLTATVWSGQDQVVLFTPAVTWHDVSASQVRLVITDIESAMLEANSEYHVQITSTRAGVPTVVYDCLLRVFPTSGLATRLILVYNTYQDMLNIAPWVASVQAQDTDQEGFYSQRLRARLWFDDIVLNSYQGGFTGQYGAHSNDFGTGGGVQSIGPDQIIRGYLAQDKLMRTPAVVETCASYAVAMVGLAQIDTGGGMVFANRGHWYLMKAQRAAVCIVAELDINADGIAEYAINLSTVATVYG